MKIRKGFVSNSSSSSFIVIGNSNSYDDLNEYDPESGEYEFGWGPDVFRDINTRINWAMILANGDMKAIGMIQKVVHSHGSYSSEQGFKEIKSLIDNHDAYIDHASKFDNEGIFKDYDKLKSFILDSKSKIVLDHDNH